MNNYCVYIHRNKINNKSYIGITGQNPLIRWQGGRHYKTCPYFNRAIQKYGWNNFEHIIFMDNLTQDEANHVEATLIRFFNTTNYLYGYNANYGGNAHKHSEQTKKKISEGLKGKQRSVEQKAAMSLRNQGGNNPRAKPVICINTNQVFNTAREAGYWLGKADGSTISKCCNGKTSHSGVHPITKEKLKWRYLNQEGSYMEEKVCSICGEKIINSTYYKEIEVGADTFPIQFGSGPNTTKKIKKEICEKCYFKENIDKESK